MTSGLVHPYYFDEPILNFKDFTFKALSIEIPVSSVDPDQTLQSAASELGLQGLHICDRLCDFGPYGGTWAKLGFLHNLTCSYVLSILVNFRYVFIIVLKL